MGVLVGHYMMEMKNMCVHLTVTKLLRMYDSMYSTALNHMYLCLRAFREQNANTVHVLFAVCSQFVSKLLFAMPKLVQSG